MKEGLQHHSEKLQTEGEILRILTELSALKTYSTSETPPPEQAGNYLQTEFEKAGLVPAIGESFIMDNEGWKTVFGRKGSGERPYVLFHGHYDIAPDRGEWTIADKHTPTILPATEDQKKSLKIPQDIRGRLGEELIVGKGSADMLGAVASMLVGIKQTEMSSQDGTAFLMLTPDEELRSQQGMIWALRQLEQQDVLPDYAIGAESTFMEILTARRGAVLFNITSPTEPSQPKKYRYRVTAKGENKHAGLFTMKQRNSHAIMNLAEKLTTVKNKQIERIHGGLATNVIPAEAEAIITTDEELQVGPVSEEVTIFKAEKQPVSDSAIQGIDTTLEALADFEPSVEGHSDYGTSVLPNIVKNQHLTLVVRLLQGDDQKVEDELRQHIGTSPDIQRVVSLPPFYQNREDPFVADIAKILEARGISPQFRENYGTSDSNNFYPYRQPRGPVKGMVEVGPIGLNEHAPDEWVDKKSLIDLAGIYSDIIKKLT